MRTELVTRASEGCQSFSQTKAININTSQLTSHLTSRCHQSSPRSPTCQLLLKIKNNTYRETSPRTCRKWERVLSQCHCRRPDNQLAPVELLNATHAIFVVKDMHSLRALDDINERRTEPTCARTATPSSGVAPTGLKSTLRRSTLMSTSMQH